jgi:hypothetical protein
MSSGRNALALLGVVLALGCVVARGDDARKVAEDPDAGFLEFLGSVDRLAEVNPDYLSQPDAPGAKSGANKAAAPARPPSPPPPSLPPPRAQRLVPPAATKASERTDNE